MPYSFKIVNIGLTRREAKAGSNFQSYPFTEEESVAGRVLSNLSVLTAG